MDVLVVAVVFAALFGLLIGSFLNVCIYRWPRDLSVVRPRSCCPGCLRGLMERAGLTTALTAGLSNDAPAPEDDAEDDFFEDAIEPAVFARFASEAQIAWYDNIPLVSYLLLRGKCRKCGAAIGWRYPLVELLTGACFAWFVWHLGPTLAALKFCVFSALVIGLLFSDLETLLLPDEMTIGGFFLGLVFSLLVPQVGIFGSILGLFGLGLGPRTGSFVEALIGGLLPAGAIWFGGWVFEKLRHKEGLGFGDVKMLAMIGTFLNIQGALMTIIVGSVAGSVIGLIYIKVKGEDAGSYQLPFGTFLGAAALYSAIAGNGLLSWYARTLP